MKKVKKILFFILLCIPIFLVQAEEADLTSQPNSEAEMVVVQNADFKAGDTVDAEGNFLGSVFYAGNNVTSSSIVDGIGFLAGNNVTIEGEKEYLITAGNNIYVNGVIKKDAIIAGNIVHISGDIGRDTYIAASTVVISGNIERNVKIYASEVTIKGNIQGNVDICAGMITIENGTVITGSLKYNDDAEVNSAENITIGDIQMYTIENSQTASEYFKSLIYSFLTSYANLLIVALVLTYFLPKLFVGLKEEYTKVKVDDYFKWFLKGAVFIIMIPILALFLLLSSVGVSFGLILLVLYIILCYLSIIVTGYLVGHFIFCKLLKKENNHYLNLLVGIAVIKILEFIPYVGSFISVISLFVGLGIALEKIWMNRNRKQA